MTTLPDEREQTLSVLAGKMRFEEFTVHEGDAAWHGGYGWYIVDNDYPEDGAMGPYSSLSEAIGAASTAGYSL